MLLNFFFVEFNFSTFILVSSKIWDYSKNSKFEIENVKRWKTKMLVDALVSFSNKSKVTIFFTIVEMTSCKW